ncbi:helix-turn-helix transcriptional regulator [Nakamurella sp.]|uniref:helix-turn-helix transcriptional regulator n=1 Tax=Nakamurella sp. TaxID=1869182 RepID=UPI003B3AAED5
MVTTKAAKAERLLNLVIALLNAPTFRSAAWIRAKVAGYGDAPSEEAFLRTFERDKKELRELGVPLQTPPNGGDGYRIPRSEFTLPPLSFTPAETAALALAGRLWETTALDAAGSGALRKIRDAEPAADPVAGPGGNPDAEDEGARPEDSVVTLLQPRVRTSDPAFEPMLAAVRAGRIVEFDYRKDPGGPADPRRLQPWGLVSFRGRWYVVGHDDRRGDRRTFRLSRIVGPVRPGGRVTVRAPAGTDLLAAVSESVQRPVSDARATLRVRSGAAAGLRRGAVDSSPIPDRPGWDRVRIPLGPRWDTARQIAAHGPDVVVEAPADLVEATVVLLTGALASARAAVGPDGHRPADDGELPFDELPSPDPGVPAP